MGTPELSISSAVFVVLGAVIGSVTFSGSLVASGKLQGIVSGAPITFPGSRLVTALTALISVAGLVVLVLGAAGVLTQELGVSSLHITFMTRDEWRLAGEFGEPDLIGRAPCAVRRRH